MGDRDVETAHTPTPGAVTSCLAIDDLVAMADGSLDTARSEQVVGHVDRCAACAEVVAKLGSLEGPLRRVGRYQIEVLLGTGGMGIVYAAYDPELQRRVAIKLVRPDTSNEKYQAMILKEARTLARVSHPNVVAVYDVGVHEGEVYVATELVDGVTLAAWQPHRTQTAIIDAWIQVARGLAAAHAQGVVHRDVKPANVFVGRDGRVRIGDFGIAHRGVTAAEALEQTQRDMLATDPVAGTPAYMAPEQKSGRVDARSDQFSTCVAIVEALGGYRPAADEVVTLEPPALAAALTRGLRANPDERFPSMTALADALQRIIAPPVRPARIYAAIAVGAVMTVATTAAAIMELRADGACRPPSVSATVWSPERRAELAKVLPADIGPAIDRYVATWTKTASDICVVTREARVRAERVRCLEKATARLDKLLAGWQATPPARVLDLYAATETLPHLTWCTNAAVVASGVPPAEHAAALEAIEDELVTGTKDSAQLFVRARATGYAPLIRRVAINRAESLGKAEALQTLRIAIAEGPNDFTKARATALMVSQYDANEIAEAEARATEARAQIAALGGDPALEAELEYRLSGAYAGAQRMDDMIAAAERMRTNMRAAFGAGSAQEAFALVTISGAYYKRDGTGSQKGREAARAADEMWERLSIEMPSALIPATPADLVAVGHKFVEIQTKQHGPGSKEIFDAEYALAYAYHFSGEPQKSIEHATRALELAKTHKIHTSRVGDMNRQIAESLVGLGRPRDAIPFATEAITVSRSLKLEEDIALSHDILGRALVDSGDLDAARAPLELVLKHFSRTNLKPGLRGRARFLLAMVQYRKGPAKALDAARIARVEIQMFLESDDANPASDPLGAPFLRGRYEQWLAKIDAWLKNPK